MRNIAALIDEVGRLEEALELVEKYSDDEPRVPAGETGGGEWTSGGSGGSVVDAKYQGLFNQLSQATQNKLNSPAFRAAVEHINSAPETMKEGGTVSDARTAMQDKQILTVLERGGYAKAGQGVPSAQQVFGHRADIVVGYSGAGKSTMVADPLVKEHGAVLVDADEMKAMLPEFNNGLGANAVHQESSSMSNRLMAQVTATGVNVVIPTVGKAVDKLVERIETLKSQGYSVHLHYMDVPWQTAIDRAMNRFARSGRAVNPNYMFANVGKVGPVYDTVKQMKIADSYTRYDGSAPK